MVPQPEATRNEHRSASFLESMLRQYNRDDFSGEGCLSVGCNSSVAGLVELGMVVDGEYVREVFVLVERISVLVGVILIW